MALLSSFPAINLLGNASSSNPSFVSPTSSQSVTGNQLTMTADYKSAIFLVKANQVAPNSSQTLTVYIQHSPDAGQTFDDFVSILVSGKTAVATVAQWLRDVAPSSSAFIRTTATTSLATGQNGVLQGPVGATWRAVGACNTSASSSVAWQINVSAQVAQ